MLLKQFLLILTSFIKSRNLIHQTFDLSNKINIFNYLQIFTY